MAGLTFVNQVGAVEGMNQAAPGTLIPETFVRWSQDVLFDRAGLMRRRGPFKTLDLYKTNATTGLKEVFDPTRAGVEDERVLAVLATYDPSGAERIGMLVDSYEQTGPDRQTILRVFDNSFTFLGEETLPFIVNPLSIITAKPALGGGLWVSIADYPSIPSGQYQFYWRGGYSKAVTSKTGTFSVEAVTGFDSEHKALSQTITLNNRTNVSVGQFVFATYNSKDYYLGAVSQVPTGTSTIILEKRPFIWNPVIDNNHYIDFTGVTATANASTITYTLASSVIVPFEIGDVVTLTGFTNANFNYASGATITNVSGSTFQVANTTSANGNASAGTVKMTNDLEDLILSNVTLKFYSTRPYMHVHGRGLLTIANDGGKSIISGTEGTSGDGHWGAANVTGYNLYRASDRTFLGKIKDTLNDATPQVSSNTAAHLYSDCGYAINGEEYIMRSTDDTDLANDYRISSDNNSTTNFAGLYTAVYAGYQWFGNFAKDDKNMNRVVFSAAHDREAVDLSLDAADSITFPGKSKFRGLGSSNAGLLVFLEDRTYILRGNDRTNFSVEQLVPEGCLCASSIVEYGGGVFWAGKSGIMYFDGASVRNLTKDNLGLFYTDSLDVFNPDQDRVIGFIHKNNLIMHYTAWKSPFDPVRYEPIYAADWQNTDGIKDRAWDEFDPDFEYDDFFTQNNTPIFWDRQILNNPEESASTGTQITWGNGKWGDQSNIQKWGPLRKNTSMTFAVYLPTNAITTLSNMDYRGVTNIETVYGLKTIVGVNSVESGQLRARLIDIHPVFDTKTNGSDSLIVEKINMPFTDLVRGPDFYLQTKHFTVGDPVLRKWFQRVMISMLLYDGAIRMDLVDDDDNDSVDINKKKHKYWEIFTEKGYDWDYLTDVQFPKIVSPNKSNWNNVEGSLNEWDELFTADFNRYTKRLSWRKPSLGFRLYQVNDYKKPYNGVVTIPTRIEVQGFSLGFKPLRQGRI